MLILDWKQNGEVTFLKITSKLVSYGTKNAIVYNYYFLDRFLWSCSHLCFSLCEWQQSTDKECDGRRWCSLEEIILGQKLSPPFYLWHAVCLWVNPRSVPWLMEKGNRNCGPHQVSRALQEQHGMCVQNYYIDRGRNCR